ncbi:MAG: PAS domain-containing protein, partial [Gemmatimonadetes bacterium]|nr:PAS domain-containing protein [Gemmatimonadota bacterium]
LKLQMPDRASAFSRGDLLRWLYLGRLTLVTGILAGALLVWRAAQPEQTFVATVVFLVALGATAGSYWRTHLLRREPSENFLYGQALLDVCLVTAIVHITGGQASDFAPLYILVISEGALLLPLTGGVLVGALASLLYFGDIVWFHEGRLTGPVALQIGLFSTVALITGLVGDRLRREGIALGAVESELRQLRLDTADILANIGTGVLTVDGTGRLAYLNPAGELLLGLEARQWLGAPVVEAVDDAAPGLGMVLRRSIEDGVPIARFKTTAHVEGREITLGVSTAILDREDGGAPSATAIFQDITHQERLEQLHRRTERLEAVAELSASLAHEIKNPLASIRSAVEQLTRGRLGEEDRALLERLVLGESDRLSRLLSEFLEFSGLRMERSEQVDMVEVVRDAVELVRQHPDADGVALTCHGHERPQVIPGDVDLLHRAIFNLVLNAAQFAGPGGAVEVFLDRPTPRQTPPGLGLERPLRLVVRDSGPGVEPGDVARIFDPFFTTREGGSGLGLAVVHRAVEAHRGAVLVDRAGGGGAEFVIILPGVAAEARLSAPGAAV